MTEEEMKAAIEAAQASIAKLEAKNKELLAEKQAEKIKADEAAELADAAAAEKEKAAKDVEAIEARLTAKHQREITKLTAQLDSATSTNKKFLIDNEITKAFADNKVEAKHHRALTALIKSEGIEIADGLAVIAGQSIADFAKGFFAETDNAHYVAAPVNSGVGFGNTGSTTTTAAKKWNLSEYMMMSKTDPTGAAAYAAANGQGHLIQGN